MARPKTIWKERSSPANVCLLGCGGCAEDSIEHYVHCRAVRRVANSFLKLGPTVGVEKFILPDEALGDQGSLVCMAVLIYAIYNTTNRRRCKRGLEHEGAVEALTKAAGKPSWDTGLARRWLNPDGFQ